ncbi:hypothetical protein CR513_18543, partial [Mucuna pruriens]
MHNIYAKAIEFIGKEEEEALFDLIGESGTRDIKSVLLGGSTFPDNNRTGEELADIMTKPLTV